MLELASLFFFKQKTAYELRIRDWRSDVCASVLDTTRSKLLSAKGRRSSSHCTPPMPLAKRKPASAETTPSTGRRVPSAPSAAPRSSARLHRRLTEASLALSTLIIFSRRNACSRKQAAARSPRNREYSKRR